MKFLQILDLDGSFISCIGQTQTDPKDFTSMLSSPGGIALGDDGETLAVADTGNNRFDIKRV